MPHHGPNMVLAEFRNMHFMEMSLGPNSPGLENIRTLFSLKVKLGQTWPW